MTSSCAVHMLKCQSRLNVQPGEHMHMWGRHSAAAAHGGMTQLYSGQQQFSTGSCPLLAHALHMVD